MSGDTVYDSLAGLGHELTNHLVGQICTLLDSALVDERQAKAAKDLARQIIWQMQHERIRGEEEIILRYRRSPETGLVPDWKEKELIDKETIHES